MSLKDIRDKFSDWAFGPSLHLQEDELDVWAPKLNRPLPKAVTNSSNTVTQEHIDSIMQASEFDVKTIYGKVTVVTAKLPNGFTIVESSACVDPANYNESIGTDICKKRIEDKVWELEGYLLQNKLAE